MPLAIIFHKEKVKCFLNDIKIYFSALDLPGVVSLPRKWLFILLCALHCACDDSVNQLKVKKHFFCAQAECFFSLLKCEHAQNQFVVWNWDTFPFYDYFYLCSDP